MASSNSQTSSDEARLCLPRAMLFEAELEVCVIELTQYQDEASEMLRVRVKDCSGFLHHVCWQPSKDHVQRHPRSTSL